MLTSQRRYPKEVLCHYFITTTIPGRDLESGKRGSIHVFNSNGIGRCQNQRDIQKLQVSFYPGLPSNGLEIFCQYFSSSRLRSKWLEIFCQYIEILVPPSHFHFQYFQFLLQSQSIHCHSRFYKKYKECSMIFCMKCNLSQTFFVHFERTY